VSAGTASQQEMTASYQILTYSLFVIPFHLMHITSVVERVSSSNIQIFQSGLERIHGNLM